MAERDYVEIAIAYAREAIKDKKRQFHGEMIRQAASRFIADLGRAKKKSCPFFFDDWHASDPCDFIEKLPHVEGTWETPTITLHPAQIFFVVQLFGFRLKESITIHGHGEFHPRRYTSALFAVARKNAKSTISAAILIYCQCCEPEPGAQVITAATTYQQAYIILRIARDMVSRTPDLQAHFGLEVWAKSISRFSTGASFKALHAKASTQDGLNPSHTALDEIHAHKTPDLLNVLKSAAGTRINSLWLYTTTEGYLNPGPWGELRHFAKQLLAGLFGDTVDHFLIVFFALDDEDKNRGIKADKDFDEKAWGKANPLIEVNPLILTEMRKLATEAKHLPSALSEFKIKRLNRQAQTASGEIDLAKWDSCSSPVDLEMLRDHPCWGGLDMSSTTDLTVFRLVWDLKGKIYTYGWRWAPEAAIAYRTERGTVPYKAWVESGLIRMTDGDTVDDEVIEAHILEIRDRFNIQTIAYDSWNAISLVNRLVKADVPLIQFIQGTKSYHPAIQDIEKAYIGGRLAHGGDLVLRWCASNLVTKKDQNLSKAPDKKRAADKIDDMCALYMARGVSLVGVPDDTEDFMDSIRDPIIA